MINNYQDERVVIEGHFKNTWNDFAPVLFENVRKAPPKTGPWVRFQIQNGEKVQASIGTSQLHRNTGQVIIQVFVKKGTGIGKLHDMVDMAINCFDTVQLDSIQFRAAYKLLVGDVGDEYYQINVIAPYYRNSLVTQ